MVIYIWFSAILALAYILLMLVYRFGIKSTKTLNSVEIKEDNLPTFSIIIPARNEADNIGKCLTSILRNQYPTSKYEIILMDDFSTDNTVELAKELLKAPNKVIRLSDCISEDERLNAFKKKALEIGIANSSGQFIITTDADCEVPEYWLLQFANYLQQQPQLECIAGPVNFTPANGNRSWLYYFQSIDFMTMQGITIASNKMKLGNMSNGANFLFSRKAYEAVDGYKGIDHKASGDDMMLMQKIQKHYPDGISYLHNQKAIVDTPVQPDWNSFMNQRIRWASKADSYPQFKMTLILLLVYLFNFNFLFLVILSCFNTWVLMAFGAIFLAKIIVELNFVIPLSKFFKKQKEIVFLILLQPLHILYIVAAGFLGKFSTYTWKGRKVQ